MLNDCKGGGGLLASHSCGGLFINGGSPFTRVFVSPRPGPCGITAGVTGVSGGVPLLLDELEQCNELSPSKLNDWKGSCRKYNDGNLQ